MPSVVVAAGRLTHGRLVGPEGAGQGARVAQVAGQAAGVDAGDGAEPVASQVVGEALGAAPVGRAAGQVPDDHAAAVHAGRSPRRPG